MIEHEATRIAQNAVLALKRSRLERERRGYSVDTPTWTGKAGTAGAPSNDDDDDDDDDVGLGTPVKSSSVSRSSSSGNQGKKKQPSPKFGASKQLLPAASSLTNYSRKAALQLDTIDNALRDPEISLRQVVAASAPDSHSQVTPPASAPAASPALRFKRKSFTGPTVSTPLAGVVTAQAPAVPLSSSDLLRKLKERASLTQPPPLVETAKPKAPEPVAAEQDTLPAGPFAPLRRASSSASAASATRSSSGSARRASRGSTGSQSLPLDIDDHDDLGASSSLAQEELERIEAIRQFLADQGGSATSEEIVAEFQMDVEGHDGMFVFRSMLEGIAECHDGSVWYLKDEFF